MFFLSSLLFLFPVFSQEILDFELSESLREDPELIYSQFILDHLTSSQTLLLPLDLRSHFSNQLKLKPELEILSVALTHSRSLQKKHTSAQTPREIFSVSFPNQPGFFLATIHGEKEFEVISWNFKKNNYDFFILQKKEAKKKYEIFLPPRKLCVKCHQNEGPIFPRFPWSETHANASNISELYKTGFFPQFMNTPWQKDVKLFNKKVVLENKRIQTVAVCKKICLENQDCHRNLLLASLSGKPLLEEAFPLDEPEVLKELQKMIHFPENGFAYPSETIPDVDPSLSPNNPKAVLSKDTYTYPPHLLNEWRQRIEKSYFYHPQKSILPGIETFRIDGDTESEISGSLFYVSTLDSHQWGNPRLPRPLLSPVDVTLFSLSEFNFFDSCVPLTREELLKIRSSFSYNQIQDILKNNQTSSFPLPRVVLLKLFIHRNRL